MRAHKISGDGALARAGRSVRFEPEDGDDPSFYSVLTRSVVYHSGVLLDDVSEVDWLAARAEQMISAVMSGEMKGRVSLTASMAGVYLRADGDGMTISIPSADETLDVEAIIASADYAYLSAKYDESVNEGEGPSS